MIVGRPTPAPIVRALREDDAAAYAALRREALLESPLAFASSPGDDMASAPAAIREQLRGTPDSAIIGAFREQLIGSVGLYRDPHVKGSHKTHLWGMYVVPDQRGRGVGSGLLEAALRHARSLDGVSWVQLCVSSAAPAARRLYERAGFRVWGTEPDALCHDGQMVVEHHMALRLEEVAWDE